MISLSDHPHRRYNPLTDEWVLVSPHRTKRPWQGQVEPPPVEELPAYDPTCYLCPGNERAGGVVNPAYEGVFVFENDFAALLSDSPEGTWEVGAPDSPPLLRAEGVSGTCRVICFSPRHDLTLARMGQAEVRAVIDTWAAQWQELAANPKINYVQIFENRGAMMGASNPHPHGQLWATSAVPLIPARETRAQATYFAKTGRTLLSDYLTLELEANERIVCANEHVVALVPFWAVWPFETIVINRRPVASLAALDSAEREGWAALIRELGGRYDRLFQVSFPYSMGLHQQPCDEAVYPEWHLHAHYYPPLLRSATIRKFMVGFELLGEAQRDITPEQAAQRLRQA